MSLAVVRCPACQGLSRVPLDALGQMVGCPRCQSPFVAYEEVPPAALPSRGGNSSSRTSSKPARGTPARATPKVRGTAVVPIAPPRRPRAEPAPEPSAELPPPVAPDPEHDPHTPPVGGLPVSVLVGFALMPFAIPLLWFVGPLVTGTEAALSLAVPVSLAIAASALCLGVVYTIDWTATTRIKGVLILVCLAYLTAAGLYFLKKDMMDRVQRFFGKSNRWNLVESRDDNFRVNMPNRVWPSAEQPLANVVSLKEGRRAVGWAEGRVGYNFFVAASGPAERFQPDDLWYKRVGEQLKSAGGQVREESTVRCDAHTGRQWVFDLGRGVTRIVRVFGIQGRVYYLSVEGPGLTPEDEELAKPFFGSFAPLPPK